MNRIEELKIKIASLAAEGFIIHARERKHTKKAKLARARLKVKLGLKLTHKDKRLLDVASGDPVILQHTKWVDFTTSEEACDEAKSDLDSYTPNLLPQSLTAEILDARIEYNINLRDSFRGHRKSVVGPAARHALLALAFLQRRPYASCEAANTREAPDWSEVYANAVRFGATDNTLISDFVKWVEDGITHLKTGHVQELGYFHLRAGKKYVEEYHEGQALKAKVRAEAEKNASMGVISNRTL